MAYQIIIALLGGGAISAGATFIWQWRKVSVDKQIHSAAGMSDLVDQLQEERDTEKASRIKHEEDLRQERANSDSRERRIGAVEHELGAMGDYLRATLAGVAAGTVPPWLEIPYTLHARFPPDSLPDISPPVNGDNP